MKRTLVVFFLLLVFFGQYSFYVLKHHHRPSIDDLPDNFVVKFINRRFSKVFTATLSTSGSLSAVVFRANGEIEDRGKIG